MDAAEERMESAHNLAGVVASTFKEEVESFHECRSREGLASVLELAKAQVSFNRKANAAWKQVLEDINPTDKELRLSLDRVRDSTRRGEVKVGTTRGVGENRLDQQGTVAGMTSTAPLMGDMMRINGGGSGKSGGEKGELMDRILPNGANNASMAESSLSNSSWEHGAGDMQDLQSVPKAPLPTPVTISTNTPSISTLLAEGWQPSSGNWTVMTRGGSLRAAAAAVAAGAVAVVSAAGVVAGAAAGAAAEAAVGVGAGAAGSGRGAELNGISNRGASAGETMGQGVGQEEYVEGQIEREEKEVGGQGEELNRVATCGVDAAVVDDRIFINGGYVEDENEDFLGEDVKDGGKGFLQEVCSGMGVNGTTLAPSEGSLGPKQGGGDSGVVKIGMG
ncbi:unnamed protein product [Choristocarpus tenellus]